MPDLGAQADQDRQHAVLVRAGARDEPFRHLHLQHQRRVLNRAPRADGVQDGEEDGRGDVVRKVSGDAQRTLGGERRDVLVKDVAHDDPGVVGNGTRQAAGQIPIDLDHRQPADARREPERQRAGPGPISMKRSVGDGAMASTTFSAQAPSRKCWPKRFPRGP